MSVSKLVLVAAAVSAYVVPLRARASLRSRRAPKFHRRSKRYRGRVRRGPAERRRGRRKITTRTTQRRLRPQGRERRGGWTEPVEHTARHARLRCLFGFSTPEVATPTRRLSLLRQRRKPRSAAASRAVRRRRALERERAQERDFEFLQRAHFVSLVLPPILAFALWPMIADAMAIFFNGQNAPAVDGICLQYNY